MSGPERATSEKMSDEELRAWTLKRGRLAAIGILVLVISLLALFAWSVLR
jgi:hypothetical protein